MNTKLNCPVCGYQEIEGNICPNCDANLTLIRTLQDLPQLEKPLLQSKFSKWTLTVALLMLIIGIGLGAGGSFLILQSSPSTSTIVSTPKAAINSSLTLKQPPKSIFYTVKSGDSLSLIAEKFCGQGTDWQIMVPANPFLEKRENYYIDPGEKLAIPHSCQEKNK
ncbi:LysM peptidoglycan-binding domain-containing protein [Anabaena sp. PCC 7108]|uniref:LysM peptidoglycan-binding domain-containing protein n=1 Tax=Anabaena sp. PCC 7108 TaxID=163908 RepID=UPI00034D556F|nr:LysM peptidoglycan-binding domain-containing protein [Anabaena sp. PCC 7108]